MNINFRTNSSSHRILWRKEVCLVSKVRLSKNRLWEQFLLALDLHNFKVLHLESFLSALIIAHCNGVVNMLLGKITVKQAKTDFFKLFQSFWRVLVLINNTCPQGAREILIPTPFPPSTPFSQLNYLRTPTKYALEMSHAVFLC